MKIFADALDAEGTEPQQPIVKNIRPPGSKPETLRRPIPAGPFSSLESALLEGEDPSLIFSERDLALGKLNTLGVRMHKKMQEGLAPGGMPIMSELVDACLAAREIIQAAAQVGVQRANALYRTEEPLGEKNVFGD